MAILILLLWQHKIPHRSRFSFALDHLQKQIVNKVFNKKLQRLLLSLSFDPQFVEWLFHLLSFCVGINKTIKRSDKKKCKDLLRFTTLCDCNLEIDSLSFCKCFVWHCIKTISRKRKKKKSNIIAFVPVFFFFYFNHRSSISFRLATFEYSSKRTEKMFIRTQVELIHLFFLFCVRLFRKQRKKKMNENASTKENGRAKRNVRWECAMQSFMCWARVLWQTRNYPETRHAFTVHIDLGHNLLENGSQVFPFLYFPSIHPSFSLCLYLVVSVYLPFSMFAPK